VVLGMVSYPAESSQRIHWMLLLSVVVWSAGLRVDFRWAKRKRMVLWRRPGMPQNSDTQMCRRTGVSRHRLSRVPGGPHLAWSDFNRQLL